MDLSVEDSSGHRQRHPDHRERRAGLGPRPALRRRQGRLRGARGADHDRPARAPGSADRERTRRRPASRRVRHANKRGAARLAAVQALYQMDVAGSGVLEITAEYEAFRLGKEVDGALYREADAQWFRAILSGVVENQKTIDPIIRQALTEDWPLSRLDSTLRAILRAGVYELMKRDDVPVAVIVSGICRHRQGLLRRRRAEAGQCRARPRVAPGARRGARQGRVVTAVACRGAKRAAPRSSSPPRRRSSVRPRRSPFRWARWPGNICSAADKSLATAPITGFNIGVALGALPAAAIIRRLGQRGGFMTGTTRHRAWRAGATLAAASMRSFWLFAVRPAGHRGRRRLRPAVPLRRRRQRAAGIQGARHLLRAGRRHRHRHPRAADRHLHPRIVGAGDVCRFVRRHLFLAPSASSCSGLRMPAKAPGNVGDRRQRRPAAVRDRHAAALRRGAVLRRRHVLR